MRTAGVTGFGGGTVTVQPLGGTTFTTSTTGTNNDAKQGSESFLSIMNVGRCYAATIVGTAAAANKAIAELNNPAASGKTVYLYSCDIFVPAAMAIALVLGGTTLAPATVPANLKAGGAAGVALVGGGNQLAPTGSVIYTTPSLAINTDYPIPQPWILELPPGTNCQLQGQTVNQAFTCNLRWIEPNG